MRRSRGEYSPEITEPEANNCFSIFARVILILFISWSVICTKRRLVTILLNLLLCSLVAEYKGMSCDIGPITTSDFLCSLV